MVQKSGDHQLRLVVYPIIYKVVAPSQVVGLGMSEPSTAAIEYHIFEPFPPGLTPKFPLPALNKRWKFLDFHRCATISDLAPVMAMDG